MKRRLGFVDNIFLRTESSVAPQHMAGLMVFKKPAKCGPDFLKHLFNEMRGFPVNHPPFNEVLSRGLVERVLPAFESIESEAIDIDYHFRHSALPRPGGELELGQLVSRLYAHPLDMTRPLWELHLIEGLDKNRFAIFCKIHHALADGTSGMKILFEWMTPKMSRAGFKPVWYSDGERGSKRKKPRGVKKEGQRKGLLPTALKQTRFAADSVLDLNATAIKSASKRFLDSGGMQLTSSAPRTPLNAQITGARRIATQDIEFARIKRLSKELDVTINVIVLALIGDALKRYIAEISTLPDKPMLAQNLVNLRSTAEQSKSGNVIGFILADLATDADDPIERVERIRASTDGGKEYLGSLSPLSAQLVSAIPIMQEKLALTAGVGNLVKPSQNIMVSNLPGIRENHYFGCCKLDSLYLPSVLDHGNSLLITLVTCVNKLCFTVVSCPDVAHSSQNLAVYLPWSLSRLEKAVQQRKAGGGI